MNPKTYAKIAVFTTVSILLLPALFVFIVDPIQLYHTQVSLKKMKYFKEQRHQNIGLVNKFLKREKNDYNTIIMGTSMSENFVSSSFDKLLKDDKVLKLTMSGGRPLEQYTLAQKALETGRVKKVIWDIHSYYVYKDISQKDDNHDFPYSLYSNDLLEQAFYYLFNQDYLKHSFAVFSGKVDWGKWTEDPDKLNYWMDRDMKNGKFRSYSEPSNIEKLNAKIIDRVITFEEIINKDFAYDNIEKYVFDLIGQYPEVEFDLFLPPYSTWFYRTIKEDELDRFMYVRKYLAVRAKSLKNVKVFGFDNEYWIVDDITNYKDYGHYKAFVNDHIMESILGNKKVLNDENIDDYLTGMIHNINKYNKITIKGIDQ